MVNIFLSALECVGGFVVACLVLIAVVVGLTAACEHFHKPRIRREAWGWEWEHWCDEVLPQDRPIVAYKAEAQVYNAEQVPFDQEEWEARLR